ncbi:hypothetical protein [Nocardia brasiliensis]|uniref:hypothetical protein n=1 Tax=Nocardia brasiliensis TaxID=37326 RepID=UPI00245601F1|nr:hypothetical protein [Nocardia brasiliensis]
MSDPTITSWTTDHPTAVAFGHALVTADWLDSPRDVVDFFADLTKYSLEFAAWDDTGRPATPADPGWSGFLNRLVWAAEIAQGAVRRCDHPVA